MLHLCPFERVMKFRLSEGTMKASRLAKWSNCTGRNTSSTWNECNDKANGTTVHVGMYPRTVIITRLKLDKDRKKGSGKGIQVSTSKK
ncbi:60S ribosomal protein L26 (Fragment) [Lemmus lemmus]